MESTKTRAFPNMYQYNFAHYMAQPKDVKDLLKVFAQPIFWVMRNFIFSLILHKELKTEKNTTHR